MSLEQFLAHIRFYDGTEIYANSQYSVMPESMRPEFLQIITELYSGSETFAEAVRAFINEGNPPFQIMGARDFPGAGPVGAFGFEEIPHRALYLNLDAAVAVSARIDSNGNVSELSKKAIVAHEFGHTFLRELGLDPNWANTANSERNMWGYDYEGATVRFENSVMRDIDSNIPIRPSFEANLSKSYFQSEFGISVGDSLTGGEKIDLVIVDRPGANVIDMSDRPENAELILAGGFGDYVNGAGGNDFIYGGRGEDTILGGAGDDWLDGGEDGDILNGGDGFDTASYRTAASGVTLDLLNPQNSTGDAAGDTLISIEKIVGSNFNDRIIASTAELSIWGGKGDDTIDLRNAFDHAGSGRYAATLGYEAGDGHDSVLFDYSLDRSVATFDNSSDFSYRYGMTIDLSAYSSSEVRLEWLTATKASRSTSETYDPSLKQHLVMGDLRIQVLGNNGVWSDAFTIKDLLGTKFISDGGFADAGGDLVEFFSSPLIKLSDEIIDFYSYNSYRGYYYDRQGNYVYGDNRPATKLTVDGNVIDPRDSRIEMAPPIEPGGDAYSTAWSHQPALMVSDQPPMLMTEVIYG